MPPSKWAFLRTRFPALPTDAKYDVVMDEQMRAFAGRELAELGHQCNAIEQALDEHEMRVRDLKLQHEAVLRVIAHKMDVAALDSIVMAGFRWTPTYEPHPVVTNKAALRAWATRFMPDNLSLPSMTLKSVVKDALDPETGSHELPPGLDVFVKRSFKKTKQ